MPEAVRERVGLWLLESAVAEKGPCPDTLWYWFCGEAVRACTGEVMGVFVVEPRQICSMTACRDRHRKVMDTKAICFHLESGRLHLKKLHELRPALGK